MVTYWMWLMIYWIIYCLFCLYNVERLMLYLNEFLWVCDFHFKHTVFPGWSSRRLCSSVFSSKEITALPHSRCWMVSYFEVDTWARLQDGTGGFFMDQSWIFWYKKMAICLRTWTFGRCGERHGMFHCCVTMLLCRIVSMIMSQGYLVPILIKDKWYCWPFPKMAHKTHKTRKGWGNEWSYCGFCNVVMDMWFGISWIGIRIDCKSYFTNKNNWYQQVSSLKLKWTFEDRTLSLLLEIDNFAWSSLRYDQDDGRHS